MNPSIIDQNFILSTLQTTQTNPQKIRDTLTKARENALGASSGGFVQTLSIEEAATLLCIDTSNKDLLEELYDTALTIKQAIYGNRMVVFAPLYVSNMCVNSCRYCGFRGTNTSIPRKTLSNEEVIEEVKVLQKQGHKRLLMLMGEHPNYPFNKFLEAVEIASSVTTPPHGEIRRINVEIPSLTCSQFKELKATGKIGTYALFQETYHKETYSQMHPAGPKADFSWRLETMDRAIQSGLDDVGIGALFGLADYRFEVLALLQHAHHLDNTYGIGPHTISIPRLQPAKNTPHACQPPSPVSDEDFKILVAVLRCAVPYTGMILTTREPPKLRQELYALGISQISAGSKTSPGSYQATQNQFDGQFQLSDNRPTEEVIKDLMTLGYIPSWCTACYRLGRTGEVFMHAAKHGNIQACCHYNGILTLAEYLADYATPETQTIGWELINNSIPQDSVEQYQSALQRIHSGERDIYK